MRRAREVHRSQNHKDRTRAQNPGFLLVKGLEKGARDLIGDMSIDVLQLQRFYATSLGGAARHLIARALRQCTRPPADARVLGLGYAAPWLERYRRDGRAPLAFMPARQGVVHWPKGEASLTALVDEAALPLPDASIDLVLIVHGLELAENLSGLLAEIWRVLAPQGHAVFVVPNRRGLWARAEKTPFGHGRPFSRGQLESLLTNAGLQPVRFLPALFMPPVDRPVFVRSAPAWERIGLSLWQGFSGLLVAETIKRVPALRKEKDSAFAWSRLDPVAQPALNRRPHPHPSSAPPTP